MLAKRLARHGLTVSAGTLAAVLSEKAAAAAVPGSLMNGTIKAVTLVAAGQAAATALVTAKVAALTEGVVKGMLLTKLKIMAALVSVLAITGIGAGHVILQTQAAEPAQAQLPNDQPQAPKTGAAAREKQSRDDVDRLQGTWRLVSSESDGVTFSEDRPEIKGTRLVIDKSSVTMMGKVFHSPNVNKEPEDMKAVGTFTLDTSKNPRQIVFTWEPNPLFPKEDLVLPALYALDGDRLKLCFNFAGKDPKHLAPTAFSAGAGSQRTLGTWKRVTLSSKGEEIERRRDTMPHTPLEKAPVNEAEEKARLQGAWQLISLEVDGLTVGEGRPELKDTGLLIKQNSLTLSAPEMVLAGSALKTLVAAFTLDTGRTPRTILLTWQECPWNGQKNFVSKAIYALEGDRLKLCMRLSREGNDKEAPREFSAGVGSARILWVFKRVPSGRKEGAKTDAPAGQVSQAQPDTPAQAPADRDYLIQVRQLKEAMNQLNESLMKMYTAAKSEEEREAVMVQATRVMKGEGAALADKALALVRPHAADKEAVEILTWLVNQQPSSPAATVAADLLARHHLQDPQTLDTASRFVHAPMSWTEPLLRKLAGANLPREQKVRALVNLAVCAKTRAELPVILKDLDPFMRSMVEERYGKEYLTELAMADLARLEATAVKQFEELANKYGSEKYGSRTVKDYAKGSLFEIRHLAVGKEAPDIEGEDIDGRKFKLSDYRGKVVLLDFWGNW